MYRSVLTVLACVDSTALCSLYWSVLTVLACVDSTALCSLYWSVLTVLACVPCTVLCSLYCSVFPVLFCVSCTVLYSLYCSLCFCTHHIYVSYLKILPFSCLQLASRHLYCKLVQRNFKTQIDLSHVVVTVCAVLCLCCICAFVCALNTERR